MPGSCHPSAAGGASDAAADPVPAVLSAAYADDADVDAAPAAAPAGVVPAAATCAADADAHAATSLQSVGPAAGALPGENDRHRCVGVQTHEPGGVGTVCADGGQNRTRDAVPLLPGGRPNEPYCSSAQHVYCEGGKVPGLHGNQAPKRSRRMSGAIQAAGCVQQVRPAVLHRWDRFSPR